MGLAQFRHVIFVGRWWKYLPVLSFSVLAAGVGLTLYRAGQPPLIEVKSTDQYWSETGLEPKALEDLVDDESCRSSQRYFLACANAVATVADRLGLRVALDGKIEKASATRTEINERRMLAPWKELYANNAAAVKGLSFHSVWRGLSGPAMPESKKAFLTGTAFNAFLSVFRDPHTYVLPINYYRDVVAPTMAPSSALGIVLSRTSRGYYLRKVMEGSPAEKAGLKRGDWILSVNGHELGSLPPQRLSEILKAENGEVTSLVARRGQERMKVDIVRSASVFPSLSMKTFGGDKPVGVLTLHKFAKGSCREFKSALSAFKDQGLAGLLIDLRDNSGGQMDEAACMVSLFVGPKAPAFRIRYLDPAREPEIYYGQEEILWTGKVAVIMNTGTASASEILAGSLRDHGKALLVGERTFGKGSFQEGEIWDRNRRVAFFQTKGFYYLPSGYSPQMHGLEPDVPVRFRESPSQREEDQYVNPLRPPTTVVQRAKAIDIATCVPQEGAGMDDQQLDQARQALFCAPTAAAAGDADAR
ncbi:MAG: PDZ domain-containing protein [Bdellovibrionaceae bacterium]|nr:PDZ domain-containing protein [Pseudobdellovibrionaceae bacterium]